MNRLILGLAVGISLALLEAPVVHARGFGGCHGGGYSGGSHEGSYSGSRSHEGSYSGGGSHEGSYSGGGSHQGSHSGSGSHEGSYSGSGSHEGSYSGSGSHEGSYSGSGSHEGSYSGSGSHEGSYSGGGSHEGSYSGSGSHEGSYSGSGSHEGSYSASGSHEGSYSGAGYHGAGGSYYTHGAAGYSTAHTALPTDAGFGVPAARTGSAAYAGYHQTEAVSGGVYAARGAAVRTSYTGAGMYGQGWYGAHPGAWAPAGWTAGRAWGAATWPVVGASFGWGSAVQPANYDYGNSITYQGDQVYYGDQPVATAEQYYQKVSALAASNPPSDPNSGDWLPLGVFALVQKDQSDPHYIVQLAVNKAGALRGNYSDLMSGTNVPIQGAVDKKSQRVAWTVGDNKQTVGEVGLYNLTQDESPALIHIGKDKTQQWTLVRLKQPPETPSPLAPG